HPPSRCRPTPRRPPGRRCPRSRRSPRWRPAGEQAGRVIDRRAFSAARGLELDPFQLRACDALDRGHSVLVAAPTGSGKTLVAEYAIEAALERGAKAFYTTPLKALSNQKFADFATRYGRERVGLLTGDNTIHGEAPVVVMT